MCCKNIIYAFIGGAVVGAGAALLFAPEKGEDMRARIKALCKKHGLCHCKKQDEIDAIVEEIAAEITESDVK